MNHVIKTERLELICCTIPMLEALFESEDALGKYINAKVASGWSVFGDHAFRWTHEKLSQPGARTQWWSYLPVLRDERVLIGSGGFKGEPIEGMVEIGYAIAESYRGRGLATEMARALIEQAFASGEVTLVQAHTLAEENESGSVLKKAGMQMVEEIEDPEDGRIWRWEVRNTF